MRKKSKALTSVVIYHSSIKKLVGKDVCQFFDYIMRLKLSNGKN